MAAVLRVFQTSDRASVHGWPRQSHVPPPSDWSCFVLFCLVLFREPEKINVYVCMYGQKLCLRLSMELSGLRFSSEELLTMRNVSVFKFVHIGSVLL